MLNEEVAKYRELSGDTNPNVPISRIGGYLDGYEKALEQTRWIPVSEKLPDEKDYCLCCDKDGYMTIGFISQWSKEWCFDDPEIDIDVIAWMPLPKRYEPQESEE